MTFEQMWTDEQMKSAEDAAENHLRSETTQMNYKMGHLYGQKVGERRMEARANEKIADVRGGLAALKAVFLDERLHKALDAIDAELA